MSTIVYLISLSGQGDTDMKLVGKDTFDWVCDGGVVPDHQAELIATRNIPYASCGEPATIEAVHEAYDTDEDGEELNQSADNDRALLVEAHSYGGEPASFYNDSMSDVLKFLKKHDLELAEEQYDGYIY